MYITKRHQTFWALHDVPRALHRKLGRRLAKSLGTSDKAEANRLASLLWLHDWSRKLKGETVRVNDDKEAQFFRDLIRNAETEEEREVIRDHIIDVAWDRRDRARGRDDTSGEAAADRFFDIATGKLTSLADHLENWRGSIPTPRRPRR